MIEIEKFINEAVCCINDYVVTNFEDNLCSLVDIYPYIEINEENHRRVTLNDELEDYLGVLYESLIPPDSKKDLGQFYTRDNKLVYSMVSKSNLFMGKILEPSCGSGCFLIEIISQMINNMKKNNQSAIYILNYITDNIYANDCDKYATQIAEINILGLLAPLMVEARNVDNTFVMQRIKTYNYDFTQKKTFEEKFSLVIGNPPFVTMYGKRSRNMTEEKRAFYNTFDFVQNKSGNNKFNLSMFFIENGLKLLQENGQLNIVLDIAFYETAFIDMRRYLVENYYIDSLTTGLQEFQNVASGQVVLEVINKKESNLSVRVEDYSTGIVKTINQEYWNNKKSKYKFVLPMEGIQHEINSKIEKNKMLDEYYPNKSLRTCCALTGKTDEFIVEPNEKCDNIVFPYIEGSKGLQGKFYSPTPKRYIKYDYDLQIKLSDEFKIQLAEMGVKNKKRVTLGDKEAYLAPKVFIRQSATEIIATYCEEPIAANNSIYVLTTKEYSKQSIDMLKYTCGLLNSDLITFFCRINKIIRAEKGKTPQIKISDLKNIRIKIDEKYFVELIEVVNILLSDPTDKLSIIRLNEIVYNIYAISETEKDFILQYLSA